MQYKLYMKKTIEKNKIKKILEKYNYFENEENPQIIIAIGGDGTVLLALQALKNNNIPILAINAGTLGFYGQKIELVDALEKIKNNEYSYKKYFCLEVKYKNKKYLALNEVIIKNYHETLVTKIGIDDKLEIETRGGGVCISTPSGSTAYNKSIDGAIVEHDLPIVQIKTISPIENVKYSNINNSLVLAGKRNIKITSKQNNKAIVSLDNTYFKVEKFKEISLQLSEEKITFYDFTQEHFLEKIKRAFVHDIKI